MSSAERCGSVVVSRLALHAGYLGSNPRPGMLYFRCKNRTLNFGDCVSMRLSDETLKAVGPSYLVTMKGEVKDPTQAVNTIMCNLSWMPFSSLEKDNSLNHSSVSPGMGCLEYITKK